MYKRYIVLFIFTLVLLLIFLWILYKTNDYLNTFEDYINSVEKDNDHLERMILNKELIPLNP